MVEVSFLKAGKGSKVAPKIDIRKLDKHQIAKAMFMRDDYFRMLPDALVVRRVYKTPYREYSGSKVVKEDSSRTTKLTIVGIPTYEIDRLNKQVADGTLTDDEATAEYQGRDLELSVVWSSDEAQCMDLLEQYGDTLIKPVDNGTDKVLRGGKIGVRPKWQPNRNGDGGAFSGLELAYEEPFKTQVEDLG